MEQRSEPPFTHTGRWDEGTNGRLSVRVLAAVCSEDWNVGMGQFIVSVIKNLKSRIGIAASQISQEGINQGLFFGQGGLREAPHYRTQDD